jgi:uncharacterized membrane protein YgaE (UPF0421/DUF939 family)
LRISTLVPALQLSLRAALAAALSYAIARACELEFPLYAMIAAVIVTDLQPSETQKLGLRRLGGTIIGSLLGAVLSILLPHGVLTIGLGIFLSMFLTHLLRAPQAARVAGYLCAIVLLEHAADPWIYSFWRFIETVLGIIVAMLLSLVPRLIRIEDKG